MSSFFRSRLRDGVKSAARAFGLDVVQHVDVQLNPFNVLAYVIEVHAARKPLSFLQVGAHDGVRNDPLRDSVLRHNLPGVLVEPMSDYYQKLTANYAGQDNVRFERCAIGPKVGSATIFRISPDAPLPPWCQGLASFDRRHICARKYDVPDLERYIIEESVPTMTVSALLEKHQLQTVGLLQVDTEGFDAEVVRQTLDAGLRPAIINYEYVHLDPPTRHRCKQQLMQCGYEFVDVGRDTLAVLADNSSAS